MRKLEREKSFIKDFHRASLNDREFSNFIKYTSLLCEGKALPKEAKDHALKGEWASFREFHIASDMLVIYKVYDESIKLIRLGTHAQLFA